MTTLAKDVPMGADFVQVSPCGIERPTIYRRVECDKHIHEPVDYLFPALHSDYKITVINSNSNVRILTTP